MGWVGGGCSSALHLQDKPSHSGKSRHRLYSSSLTVGENSASPFIYQRHLVFGGGGFWTLGEKDKPLAGCADVCTSATILCIREGYSSSTDGPVQERRCRFSRGGDNRKKGGKQWEENESREAREARGPKKKKKPRHLHRSIKPKSTSAF